MKCPYCGTENPEDAQECSNCSADLASLPKGAPPLESLAPTMMTTSAEVAAMLAAARETSTPPPEPSGEPAESAPPPDSTAPTIMTSSVEIAAMLSETRTDPEVQPGEGDGEAPLPAPTDDLSLDVLPVETQPEEDLPLEELPMGLSEAPMGDSQAYAPTMISRVPDEVAEVVAAVQAGKIAEEARAEEPVAELAPATMVGIPDPLGVTDSGKFPASEHEPASPPTPVYPEPASTPVAPETPKDNRRMWIIGGVSCLGLCCLCSLGVAVVNILPALMESLR